MCTSGVRAGAPAKCSSACEVLPRRPAVRAVCKRGVLPPRGVGFQACCFPPRQQPHGEGLSAQPLHTRTCLPSQQLSLVERAHIGQVAGCGGTAVRRDGAAHVFLRQLHPRSHVPIANVTSLAPSQHRSSPVSSHRAGNLSFGPVTPARSTLSRV